MINTEHLFVERAIIHRLDNQNYPNGKELSDLELELDEELRNVITEHAKSGINDKRRRYARFNDKQNNAVRNYSFNIQKDINTFVDNSKAIANNLYQHMSNKNISAADLVVCYARDDKNYFIGILKLDYKNQYISQIEHTNDGKKRITIRKEEKGWPELGTRIQKIAFIKVTNLNDEEKTDESIPDLIVLDRQKSAEEGGEISRFFKDSFLNVELIADEKSNTSGFIKGLKVFLANYETISYEKRRAIYDNGLDAITRNEIIDVESFIEQQFDIEESAEDKRNAEALMNYLTKHGVTRGRFSVADEIANKYKKRRLLILDGIKLDIDLEIYKDKSKFEINYYKESGIEFANITIKGLRVMKNSKDD